MASNPSDAVISLFEDESVLAIHKPAGIPFHSDDDAEGIVRLVRKQFNSESLFPVHRLDRMTSGLMLFAKTPKANESLSRALADKHVEKYYLAVATKKPTKKQGLVKGDMEKSRRGSYKLSRTSVNPAITRFFAKSFERDTNRYWGFILKPETGKTHQLRVALKSLGSPILGDTRYGSDLASRGYLHAYLMRFDLFSKRYQIADTQLAAQEVQFADLQQTFSEIAQPHDMPWGKNAYLLP